MSSTGPDHEKMFTARAQIGGETFAATTGRSKKEAEQSAAEEAFRIIAGRGAIAVAADLSAEAHDAHEAREARTADETDEAVHPA
jgi:ribonuclease-3